ncbi:hypothetical protein WICANDRAFT_65138 [Wickerhamomyces anomalus NRRL Y-366-8]|uniref:Conserved oligomeric Golgi complex subunit 5 n=1 Tax=Wickerhamomyces anomalus (strain ATCC 58044 / CBS 1984 / NCYC 433 / NRRL Y-366-8) TaxID=683960 RepID=A0A1E3NXS0_WICAA|nr:uncharacterized protein WICANDRAFT_65138 [Wickerhamomyces anomalus NRRL Y-366-8]ODQ57790.1 hypothetical protein WICANDRAFT_65138 [Wickerhamomyces anomalus NRRL Y-366-8]
MSNSQNIDLSDYDTFLEPDFNPISFANDLLLATNSSQNELDLSTSIKRVKFDINNIDLNLEKISTDDHDNLIKEIHKSITSKELFQQITPQLDHVNSSYQRLEKDIIDPYKEATKIQDALKKLHSTSYLLRSVTYFLYLVQQIEDFSNSEEISNTIPNNSKINTKLLVKLSKYHQQLNTHISKNPNLKSLRIVREYEPIAIERTRSLLQLLKNSIKSIDERSIKSKSDIELKEIFQSLALLDKSELYNSIRELLSTNVIISVNFLTRVLNSPRNLENALDEVAKKGTLISKISKILDQIDLNSITDVESLSTSSQNNVSKKSLLNDLLDSLEIVNLLSVFWRDVAKKFELKFKETMNRGGPVAKSLSSYKEQIRASIIKKVTQSDASISKDGIEVRMMLNSVSTLERIR